MRSLVRVQIGPPLDYFQIQRQAAKEIIPESIIEKDYFIELLLFYFGNDDLLNKKIVFRGGTALKKI
jgi:predicted nucleotidyltransferase component of viral defense system